MFYRLPSILLIPRYYRFCRWGHRYLGGPKVNESTPYQLKACVSGGLVYAAVHTLPSLILKYDLPCFDCETELWYERTNLHSTSIDVSLTQHMTVFTELFLLHLCSSIGKSAMCKINRSSIFVLLFIQINLCDMSRDLNFKLTDSSPGNADKNKIRSNIFRVLSMFTPVLLLAISYGGTMLVCFGS
jgi:hypothetical protein